MGNLSGSELRRIERSVQALEARIARLRGTDGSHSQPGNNELPPQS